MSTLWKKVGRDAKKCWKCGEDLSIIVSYRQSTKDTKKSGWGLEHASLFMVLAGAFYYISSIIGLFNYGGSQICLGDIFVILIFVGAFLTLTRISYIGASICCLIPGIFMALKGSVGALICILIAAHLLYKNKDEFS